MLQKIVDEQIVGAYKANWGAVYGASMPAPHDVVAALAKAIERIEELEQGRGSDG